MNFKATKHLLLTSACSLLLLPGISLVAWAHTDKGQPTAPERYFQARSHSIQLSRAMTISDVRSLYVEPFTPDSGGFRANVIEGLRDGSRFRVVSSRAQADAVVEGAARSTGYGFWGRISVRSARDNHLLWSGEAKRHDGTRDRMAFQQLVSRLTSAAS